MATEDYRFERFESKFPNVFKEGCYIECGKGWDEIIDELCTAIEPLCAPAHITAIQVKEKFGGLRFYMSGAGADIYSHIRRAEEKALGTCERTCTPGKLRTDIGWMRVLCDDEYNKEKEQLRN